MGGFGSRVRMWFTSLPPVVRQLLVLQVLVWLSLVVLSRFAPEWYQLVVQWGMLGSGGPNSAWIWLPFTYWVLTPVQGMFNLLLEMVLLVSLGRLFGWRWRRNHFLFFWVVSAAFAGWLHLIANWLFPTWFPGVIAGAQAPIMALLAAFLLVFGTQRFRLWGLEKPLKGAWIVWGVMALQLVFFVAGMNVAFVTQVGGFLAGWLLVTGRWRPGRLLTWAKSALIRIRMRRRGFRTV